MAKKEAKGRGMAAFQGEHYEKKMGNTKTADPKYGTEFGNPEDLKESVNKLSDYVKKNKMKY